ncbi:MAG: hypothetical protein LBD75_06740, partial [Candidatus Peribacteria bacterium]|nr:hypothetical protein [Candidatus Peribacteria bacterium]
MLSDDVKVHKNLILFSQRSLLLCVFVDFGQCTSAFFDFCTDFTRNIWSERQWDRGDWWYLNIDICLVCFYHGARDDQPKRSTDDQRSQKLIY